MTRAVTILSFLVAALSSAAAQDRVWPSAPFRGQAPQNPPCTCRGPGLEAEVGQTVCLSTPAGGRRARCVMVENNTSWAIGEESCGATASLR